MTMDDKEFDKCKKELNKQRVKKYYLVEFENIIHSAFRLGYTYGKSCQSKEKQK